MSSVFPWEGSAAADSNGHIVNQGWSWQHMKANPENGLHFICSAILEAKLKQNPKALLSRQPIVCRFRFPPSIAFAFYWIVLNFSENIVQDVRKVCLHQAVINIQVILKCLNNLKLIREIVCCSAMKDKTGHFLSCSIFLKCSSLVGHIFTSIYVKFHKDISITNIISLRSSKKIINFLYIPQIINPFGQYMGFAAVSSHCFTIPFILTGLQRLLLLPIHLLFVCNYPHSEVEFHSRVRFHNYPRGVVQSEHGLMNTTHC